MNTGSGKTVVGLMILQSCLSEGKSAAVYVVLADHELYLKMIVLIGDVWKSYSNKSYMD